MRKIIITAAACLAAVTQMANAASRLELSLSDNSFNKNGNTVDAAANSFTINNSFGSVSWTFNSLSLSQYQYLVVKTRQVAGNNLRIVITDNSNVDYNHRVGIEPLPNPQEIIIDLACPLMNDDRSKTLDKSSIKRITFWNYWDNGDGIESATVKLDEVYLEPYGTGDVHIGNPIIQTNYTSDPAPMVYGDRLYVFTGHDEDGASYYEMNEWRVYSTTDMVNWTDHGSPIDWTSYSWCKGAAWAAQPISRDGKVYFYTSSEHKNYGHHVVGVATADSPEGPYKGAPTSLTKQYGDIDPTAFIDEDGQGYVYYGNNGLRYVLLKPSLVTVKSGPYDIPLTKESFGGVKVDGKIQGVDCYEEGPWFYRRGNKYYLLYAAGGIPEHISYSMSDTPTGPWVYKGVIMPSQGGSFTNHPGVIDYKGHSYLAYHNGALPGGGGFQRSVAFEEFEYNPDGTFPTINMTSTGVDPIDTLNPYELQQAETIAWSYGLKTAQDEETGVYVTSTDAGDYQSVREVEFGEEGAVKAVLRLRGVTGGKIEIRLDSPKGKIVGIANVDGYTNWKDYEIELKQIVTGKHDIWFTYKNGKNMMDFDRWQFFDEANAGAASIDIDKPEDGDIQYYNPAGVPVEHPSGLVISRKGKEIIK